jgi:putative hemolysin
LKTILVEVGVILVLVVANGLFSMSELAIVSARKARLRQAAEDGDGRAAMALELAEDPNRFLSTVQVGITVVGTLAGVFGGATIAARLAGWIATFQGMAPYAEAVGLTVIVAIISYLTLVLGELVPKRLAMNNPEAIASTAAGPLRALSVATVPLVKLLGWSTEVVLRLLRSRPAEGPAVTEEEIHHMVREGAEAGAIESVEGDMVRRLLRLDDMAARVLMTQRGDVVWVDADGPPEEARRRVVESAHSILPACEGSLDNVMGVVQAKDLLSPAIGGGPLDVRALMKPAHFIFEGVSGLRVLEQFKSAATSMVIVVDEYGSVVGVLTHNDILQAIVGDIPDEHIPDPRAVRRDDGSWLLDGTLAIAEVADLPGLPRLPEGDYGTLAGFILAKAGRIPRVGDRIEWEGRSFEVVDMDENRIDRVLVGPLPS